MCVRGVGERVRGRVGVRVRGVGERVRESPWGRGRPGWHIEC